jgi:serine/threonine protein kinase
MPDFRPLRPEDPERVGDYRLVGLLGEGGQGVVYLGERLDGTEPSPGEAAGGEDGAVRREWFAIKLLRTHLSGDERARRYFAREFTSAQRVDPSFTARIVEADVEGRTPYIVSEYVEGRALSDVVREQGPLSGAELHRLAIGTLRALAAIHQANVVHRDFKPNNVLLGADRPRVIDFGIARALDSTMSMTSGVVGTPAYMAPEQLNGHRPTPAVDVFAWGATMVFAATGRSPFGRGSLPVMMNRILTGDPDIGTIASPLRELVWSCMYKDPARRPTAAQLLARLGEPAAAPGVFSQTPAPRPAVPPEPTPRPAVPPEPTPRPAVLPAPASDGRPPAATVDAADLRPRRLWFVVAALILAAGIATCVVLLANLGGTGEPTRTFAANETATVRLTRDSRPGFYATAIGSPAGRCFARDATGRQIWAKPNSGTESVTIDDTQWYVLSHLDLPADGTYQVGCTGANADARYGVGTLPEAVTLITTFSIAILVPLAAGAAAIAITIAVAVRRGSHRRRLLAAPAPDRGRPVPT